MKIIESLEKRRSYYSIGKELPVSEAQVTALVEKLAELVPDAFNMKSSRVVVALGEKQDMLWNTVYDAFGGKVAREKIDSFRAGAGTVLYFYDEAVVQALQAQFPLYAANFPGWALQSSGMLQLSVWSGLRERPGRRSRPAPHTAFQKRKGSRPARPAAPANRADMCVQTVCNSRGKADGTAPERMPPH